MHACDRFVDDGTSLDDIDDRRRPEDECNAIARRQFLMSRMQGYGDLTSKN